MCTILIAWQWRPDVPLVLAANRDELLGRATDAPMLLHEGPAIWGGRDRVAGGTWLAVDPAARRVCGLTNRYVSGTAVGPDPTKRSRGELPLLVLTGGDDVVETLSADDYNPVNLISFAPGQAWWSTLGGTVDLTPGVHVLTVRDLDDPDSPKAVRLLSQARRAAAEAADAVDLRDRLAALLTSHETDPGGPAQSAACIHGDLYGTVSSSTVVVSGAGVELRYAQGRPCVTAYGTVNMSGSVGIA